MPVITNRNQALEVIEELREKKVSMAIFCTASHWNTEAILMAASNFANKNNLKNIPLAVAMTFNYQYMPQTHRVTFCKDPQIGFISVMDHLKLLCHGENSPYSNVTVLPHLDHADPVRDKWALTEGLPYLASVMFDAQKYPDSDNIEMTRDYVKEYGKEVLVEGIMDQLSVEGNTHGNGNDSYIEKAIGYTSKTGIDFLVADLGTEQQSSSVGKCSYLRNRATELTKNLGKSMLVLHGTSCLSNEQMSSLPGDGIIRVNMWTRIAREAGRYAADRLAGRADEISKGVFEAVESKQYIYDNMQKAAEIMEETLNILGYSNLKN